MLSSHHSLVALKIPMSSQSSYDFPVSRVECQVPCRYAPATSVFTREERQHTINWYWFSLLLVHSRPLPTSPCADLPARRSVTVNGTVISISARAPNFHRTLTALSPHRETARERSAREIVQMV